MVTSFLLVVKQAKKNLHICIEFNMCLYILSNIDCSSINQCFSIKAVLSNKCLELPLLLDLKNSETRNCMWRNINNVVITSRCTQHFTVLITEHGVGLGLIILHHPKVTTVIKFIQHINLNHLTLSSLQQLYG